MKASKGVKKVLDDMNKTLTELQSKELIRDSRGISQRIITGGLCKITYPGKNDASNIVFDKHIDITKIMDKLLDNLQYTVLLYDKGLIQAEFVIDENKGVIKERLVFMKKHNKIWDIEEIIEHEGLEEDWFSDAEGIPIMLRVDYAPDDHIDGDHAAAHLTMSNHESCRIPIKGIVTFSEFVRFVLFHFYNIRLDKKIYKFDSEDTITELEKKMMHIDWE